MNSEELKERTKSFAHRCVKLAMALPNSALGNVIRGQLIRCATSTSSNYRAACLAQSKPAFTAKISTVLEEADESWFWLEFIVDEKLMARNFVTALLDEAAELTRIFAKTRKTSQKRE